MTTMVLEIPDVLKRLVAPVHGLFDELRRQIDRGERGITANYEEFEQRLGEQLAAIERGAHEATLAALDVDAPRLTINGVEHVRVGHADRTYMTKAGPAPVAGRALYRRVGDRNGKVVDLVTLRSGAISDVWLPGTARAMAHLMQQGTAREAETTAERLGRLPYSRSSFDRVAHDVGQLYVDRQQDIDEQLIRALQLPPETASISVSLDRVSIPMEEPRPRPPGRPRKGAPKRPVSRVYRMAYCGTVTMHDGDGQALHTIRYGCMPEGDVEGLLTGMAGDVLAVRERLPNLALSMLSDGAPEMWNLLEAELDEATFGSANRLIDFYHLIEKLAPAATVLHGAEAGKATLKRWKLRLLNCNAAVDEILEELVASGKEHVQVGAEQPVHNAITYLTNNGERMHYAAARRRGLPIASGNVEATCKSLVGIRMKRAGSRWKTETGDHILHLRALSLSDRWEQAMDITLRAQPVRVKVAA